MKNSIKSVASIVLACALSSSHMFAKGNGASTVLSDSAWQEIEASVEAENYMLEENVAIAKPVTQSKMNIGFAPGKRTNVLLFAAINGATEVNVTVVDNAGVLVYQAAGKYNDVKSLHFEDYYEQDMNYTIKLYTEAEVFEAKIQVAYR